MAKNALGQDISFDSTGKMVFTGTPNAKVTADQATQSRANALAFQAQNLAQRQAPTTPPVAPTTPTQGQVTNQQYQPGTLLPGESIIGTRATPQAVNAGVNATITPGGMTQTTGANIPTPTKPVQATLLGADLATTQANQFAQNAVSGLSEAEQARQTSLNALIEQITGQKTQTQLQAENYGAVDTAQQELNDINNQLLTEQNAQRRREEALVATGDLTAEQAQQKINETRRQSISKQADLSIIQMAKQNNYATAKEIADRKVQAQVEADKLKLDTLQFIYTENKELFNKKEQRQFELAQVERTRLLDKQEKELTQINDLALNALQNGAPASIVQKMQQSKTLADATKLGGAYVDKLDRTLKQAQIANIYSEIKKRNTPTVAQGVNGIVANMTPAQQTTLKGLLDDFDAQTKSQRTVVDAAQNIATLADRAKQGNASSQIALVFSYMKSLDPNSTVREGEFATAKNSAGIPDRIRNTYNQALNGTFLTNGQVDSFSADAQKLAQTALSQMQTRSTEFDRRANVFGIPSGLVYSASVGDVSQNVVQNVYKPTQQEEDIFLKTVSIPTTSQQNISQPAQQKTVSDILFGNKATTNTVIPSFSLNNFTK